MNIEQLYRFINKEEEVKPVHQTGLKTIIDKYPYFQAAIFLYLKSLYQYNIELFNKELSSLSISINDRVALFFFIFSDEYNRYLSRTEKKTLPKDKTGILLNAFFETHNMEDSTELEYNLAHSTLASTDYFSYISKADKPDKPEIESPKDLKHQDIIDTFIRKSEEKEGIQIKLENEGKNNPQIPVQEDDDLNDDIFFTETLAKIFIKQKKYQKAYKIIKHLSLNYPKKNVYFADQLSFLEKLIINSKFKDKK